MKLIITAELTQGYELWKNLFLATDSQREKYGVKVLAYGHAQDNENKIYQVVEVESMERMQEGLQDPEIAKLRTDAGVNLDSQEVVFLVEWEKNLTLSEKMDMDKIRWIWQMEKSLKLN